MESEATVGGRLRSMAEGARRNAPPPLLRIATRTASGLQEIEPFDRAMTLAAQTFTSVFPLIIAVAALLPTSSRSLSDRLSDGLGLPDSSRAALELVLPAQPQTRGAFGILGVIIVVFSATSLSRALARMYAKVWQVPPCRRHDRRMALGCRPVRGGVVLHHGAGSPLCQLRKPLRYGGLAAPHVRPEQSSVGLGAMAAPRPPGLLAPPAARGRHHGLLHRGHVDGERRCTCRGHWSAPPNSSEHSASPSPTSAGCSSSRSSWSARPSSAPSSRATRAVSAG